MGATGGDTKGGNSANIKVDNLEQQSYDKYANKIREYVGTTDILNSKEYEDSVQRVQDEKDELDSRIKELEDELKEHTTEYQLDDDDREFIKEMGISEREYKLGMGNDYDKRGYEIQDELRDLRKQSNYLSEDIDRGLNALLHNQLNTEVNNYMSSNDRYDPNTAKLADLSKDYQNFDFSKYSTLGMQDKMDNNTATGRIVEMTPKQYIQEVAYNWFNQPVDVSLRNLEWKNIDKYVNDMKNGDKFPVPHIVYGDNTDSGQQGRHRAIAAILNGVKTIPVYVENEQYRRYK